MKYFLLIFVLALISFALSTEVKTETKKNGETIMDYMAENSLSNYSAAPKKNSAKKKKKVKSKVKLIKRKKFKDPIKVFHNGWLQVSSPMFRHTGRFPPMLLPDGRTITIKTNKKFFRINTDYNKAIKSKDFPPGKLYFWMRLSGKNIYYSSNQKDINILGNIAVKNLIDAHQKDNYSAEALCFKVHDREDRRWKLCAPTMNERNKWICKIKEVLGLPDKTCTGSKMDSGNGKLIVKTIIQPTILIPLASHTCNENWDYKMKGCDWECDCKEGKEQSPINLPPKDKAIGTSVKPLFQYNELEVNREEENLLGETVTVSNNSGINLKFEQGALRIKHKDFGRLVTMDGAIYFAEEIVFHTPAEHTINGKRHEMEMQIIHYGATKGDTAKQVILSFLFEKKAGVYNKFIDDLDFFNLPNPVEKEKEVTANIHLNKIFYGSQDKEYPFWKPFSFFTYRGSISQPPCTERTIVYVGSKTIKIGSTALELFREAIRVPDMQNTITGEIIVSQFPRENNREVQNLFGRAIFHYDHVKYCGPDPPKQKVKPKGHFEKVIKKLTSYFYVNGEHPSGVPGAFVVSEKEAKKGLGKK
jgi:carbonic anhydrase